MTKINKVVSYLKSNAGDILALLDAGVAVNLQPTGATNTYNLSKFTNEHFVDVANLLNLNNTKSTVELAMRSNHLHVDDEYVGYNNNEFISLSKEQVLNGINDNFTDSDYKSLAARAILCYKNDMLNKSVLIKEANHELINLLSKKSYHVSLLESDPKYFPDACKDLTTVEDAFKMAKELLKSGHSCKIEVEED